MAATKQRIISLSYHLVVMATKGLRQDRQEQILVYCNNKLWSLICIQDIPGRLL